MDCLSCKDIVERPDIPHIITSCKDCGRELRIVRPGAHGIGLQVEAGERLCIPAGSFKMSFNPLDGGGRFTRPGLEPFAAMFFVEGLHTLEDTYPEQLAKAESQLDEMVNAFPPLAGLDVNRDEDTEQIGKILSDHKATPQFWAYYSSCFLSVAQTAIQENDALRASWATACAERFRSMMVFKEALEDVVWMGHSFSRVMELLRTWYAHQDCSDEEFWQITLTGNSYALSQVFAVPMVFIQDKAYVGGMSVDRSEARFVDYLFSTESSREAALVEIKTPCTKLLGAKYRNTYAPSRELTGAIAQVIDYRRQLTRNLDRVTEGTNHQFNDFNPRCAIIIGNTAQLDTDAKRSAFAAFRGSLKDIEVITYDELFRKVEILAELFGLKKDVKAPEGETDAGTTTSAQNPS